MKRVVVFLLFMGFVCLPLQAKSELPSCDELLEMANVLDEVNTELDRVGSIPEDGELDQALGEVVTALEEVAEIEDSKKLSQSVAKLAKAWEEMDGETFQLALDEVIIAFDKIRHAECP